ncbi:uncharacterized protein LOC134756018 [Cydia strobilella]|uniref:uncharacterized protein LOC134756018 n=1 Tax=Cydia strobilella TaxID=1100964 RepID=UPI00300621C6
MRTVVILVLAGFASLAAASSWKQKKTGKHFFSNDAMDVTDFSVYYDLETNKTITRMMPRPWYKPGWMLRLPFTGGPCSCKELRCTCCTGIRIQSLNFDRKTCAVLTFDPSDSMIEMDVQMNNATVYKTSFSAANAPPFCVPIPVPYLPPGLVDMCIRLFDITLIDQGVHVCMDMDTRIDKAPVLILHFDCMDMGLKGVMLSKPGSATTIKPVASDGANSTAEPEQINSDVFDTVTESSPTTEAPIVNFVKYI